MKYIIDRIEGEFAVCETEEKMKKIFPISVLYMGARAGDHFTFSGNTCIFLADDTMIARNKNILLQKSLFEE